MPIKTIEDVKKYVDKGYWESGVTEGRSGYEKFEVNWWWNLRWWQCWDQVFPSRDKCIIDLGCAMGGFVAALLTAGGADAHGIDLSEYAVKKGIESYEPLTERLHVGSIHDLTKFRTNQFDYIYSNQVFEHLPEHLTDLLVQEIARVLKPGGFIWAGLVLGVGGKSPDDPDDSHINIHPRQWWDRKFLSNGFIKADEADRALRRATCGPDNPGYSYFKEYDWHSICYRKL